MEFHFLGIQLWIAAPVIASLVALYRWIRPRLKVKLQVQFDLNFPEQNNDNISEATKDGSK